MATHGSSALLTMYDKAASFASNQLKILFDVNEGISFLNDSLPIIRLEISITEEFVLTKKTGVGKMVPAPSTSVQAEGIRLEQEESRLQILRDLAYEAEDVLDEVSTKGALYPPPDVAARLPPRVSRVCPGTLSFYVDLVCGCFAPSCLGYSESSRSEHHWPILFYFRIANRINTICTDINKLSEKQERLESIMSEQSRNIRNTLIATDNDKCRHTTSLVPGDFELIGREEEREYIMNRLWDPKPEVSVISIVGMGGVGKTKLAQDIFGKVEKHFEFKKWVYVGMAEVETVMKRIVDDSQSGDDPAGSVVRELGGKKFLIILDDVWYEDDDVWEKLWTPLSRGGSGSRIIITTQKKNVAKTTRGEPSYHLEPLRPADCLSLFRKHAFPGGYTEELPHFVELGEEIAGKLGGLPLAAKVIGRTLYHNRDVRKWEDIRDNISGVNLDNEKGIMSVLMWSYCFLPHYLKPCFKYCSFYTKGSWIRKSEIVGRWMAQGYIQFEMNKRPEDIGYGYIDDLISASLFQDDGYGEAFVLHDYIHGLAKLASGGEILSMREGSVRPDDLTNLRHLAIYCEGWDPASIKWESLRTLIIPNERLSKDIISQLRCIRVLVVHKIESIEDFTDNLIHLRFLRLVEFGAPTLESLSHLRNLETLSLAANWGMRGSIRLQHLSKLANLRVFESDEKNFFEVEGVGNLKSLQHLSQYNILVKAGYEIDELKDLSQLHGSLKIGNLQNVKGGIAEAKEALMENKEFLEKLKLEWEEDDVLGWDEELLALPWYDDELLVPSDYVIAARRNQEDVLEGLRPHSNLKELEIRGFAGLHCSPSWMSNNVLTATVSITLANCRNVVELPPLGQLGQLKKLNFLWLSKLRKITRQFYGKSAGESPDVVFRSLEVLEFWEMDEWQEWEDLDDNNGSREWFPSLQKLEIRHCGKLRAIPRLPSSTRELQCVSTGLTVLPKFWGCNDAQHQLPVFLSTMTMEACPLLESIGECLLQHQHSSSMKMIVVQWCENLKTLDLGKVVQVSELRISDLDALDDITWGCLTSLERLTLNGLRR